jgi:hypothetical protein
LNGKQAFPIAVAVAARSARSVFATGYGEAFFPPPLQKSPILQKPFARMLGHGIPCRLTNLSLSFA